MLHIAWWLAYFVPMAALGVGFTYWMLTLVPTAAARDLKRHSAPAGVTVDPASAQAIHDELDRRKRAGLYAGGVLYCVLVAVLHPMYAPERLVDAVGGTAWFIGLAAGIVGGETYVATRAATVRRPAQRMASTTPRDTTTYLSQVQRYTQTALLATLTVGAAVLTIVVLATAEPVWAGPAMVGAWTWLAGTCVIVGAQRHVLAQPALLDGESGVLVREFVTSNAIQLLYRASWLLGMLVYFAVTAYIIGPSDGLTALTIELLPLVGFVVAAHWIPRLLHRPDPLWHFARTRSLA